jgi:hypothetical protein
MGAAIRRLLSEWGKAAIARTPWSRARLIESRP